jgi:hypothetical protein
MDVTGDIHSSRAPNKCRLVITIFDKDALKVNGDIMNMYIIALGEIIIRQGAGTPVGWHPL